VIAIDERNLRHRYFPAFQADEVTKVEQTKGLGLWCLMPLSTIFQLYRGGQFY
jgi:hypothetical protein